MVSVIVSTNCPEEVENVHDSVRGESYLELLESYLDADFPCDIGFVFIRTKPREGSES